MYSEFIFPTADGGTIDLKDQRRTDLARRVRDYSFSGAFPLPTDPAEAQVARDQMLTLEVLTKAEVGRGGTPGVILRFR